MVLIAMEHERRFWGADNILYFDVGGNHITQKKFCQALPLHLGHLIFSLRFSPMD